MMRSAIGAAVIVVASFASYPARAADALALKSTAFADDNVLDLKYSGNGSPNCRGENISPPFTWSGVPQGTKSFALLMFDLDGRNGLGVSHQVLYGIPADVASLAESELDHPSKFVSGKGTRGLTTYLGPCPPPGTGAHHYVFTLIATDLDPKALEAGLTREQLLDKLNGHAKGGMSLIGRFGGAE